jgi:hypothetical protein
VSADNLLRQSLRVGRELVGSAHPFIVTGYKVFKGGEVVVAKTTAHENPMVYAAAYPPRTAR